MGKNYLFTSESVTEGHPDKLCDKISDAVLDAYLKEDPDARVACEVTATTGIITVMGEVSSNAGIDIPGIVRNVVREVGYTEGRFAFDAETCAVVITMDKQSEDIDRGVSRSLEYKHHKDNVHRLGVQTEQQDKEQIGAGDQGMMFGYACNDTVAYMPAPVFYAHKLCSALSEVRKSRVLDYLGPDGKSMVTFEYENGKPVRIASILISTQHLPEIAQDKISHDILNYVIKPVIPKELMDDKTRFLINPTGRFVHGGPSADTGLTGRKIIVDTYGGMGRHGGGAFSGKDPTKVDRTGAYAARYVAKNIVAARLAQRCEVQIAYAIGVANPVSVNVDTFGTSEISEDEITQMIEQVFDLRPAVLIGQFDLKRPIYKKLAAYGHFGRTGLEAPWEICDKVQQIQEYFKGR